jgi:hypothetical protein
MRRMIKVALAAPVVAGLVGGLGLGTVAQAHADWHDVSGYLGCLRVSRINVKDPNLAITIGRAANNVFEQGLDSLAVPGWLEDHYPPMNDATANIIFDCAQRFRP